MRGVEGYLLIVQQRFEVAFVHQFGDNAHVAGYRTGTHVEQDVGMEDATHNLHLFSERIEGVLIKILSMQHLDCYLLRTTATPGARTNS